MLIKHNAVVSMATSLLAIAFVVLPAVGRAWADLPQQGTGGGQNFGPGSVSINAGNDNSTPGIVATNTGSGGGGSPCQWTYEGPNTVGGYAGPPLDWAYNGVLQTYIPPSAQGTWFLESCPGQIDAFVFVPTGQPAPAGVSPQQLSVEARNLLTPPAPPIQMSPAADANHQQYVNVPSWAWVPAGSWVPLYATASVPGVVVTATATPVELDITYSDGGVSHAVKCSGPGTAYSDGLAAQIDPAKPLNAASPTCGWTFRNSSAGQPNEAVPVSARIVYSASWTVTGAAGGGNLGAVTSPADNFSVRVAEVQSIVVS